MTTEAIEGWSELCCQPFSMCFTLFLSVLSMQTVLAIMLAGKRPVTAWHVIVPHTTIIGVWSVLSVRMWRMGPQSAGTMLSGLLAIPHMMVVLFVGISTCTGPNSWMPYGDRSLGVVLLSFLAFFVNMTGNCGAVPTLHPEQPHPNLQKPLLQSLLETGRIMDTLTDTYTVRNLLLQVCCALVQASLVTCHSWSTWPVHQHTMCCHPVSSTAACRLGDPQQHTVGALPEAHRKILFILA